jgi:undecaprenyl-diphosphatase
VPILHAIVTGLTQGLTEFFPISSSGHLAIVPWLFGWDDFGGDESLHKAFDVALHLGTFVGVVAYFRKDIVRFVRGGLAAVFRRSDGVTEDGRMAWLLVLSAIPAAITGALFNDLINELDDQIWLIAVMLVVFALVLYWADHLPERRAYEGFRTPDALLMGTGQALALQPGVSRSGVTISVARWRGFNRDAAARLSFLMSLPVIAGAGLYQGATVMADGGIPEEMYGAFFWGMVSAAVSGWFAVWATLKIVRTHSFTPFVVYRIAIAAGILLLIATGARPAVA